GCRNHPRSPGRVQRSKRFPSGRAPREKVGSGLSHPCPDSPMILANVEGKSRWFWPEHARRAFDTLAPPRADLQGAGSRTAFGQAAIDLKHARCWIRMDVARFDTTPICLASGSH